MKKIFLLALPVLLSGCSYYDQVVEHINTDTLDYQCGDTPISVTLNKNRQQVSFVYDDKPLTLTQGRSASGTRYTDGIYVFWSKGNNATIYKRDSIVLDNCQLQTSER